MKKLLFELQFIIAYNREKEVKTLHSLSEKIKFHRLITNKTQHDMSQILNVQRATYGEYERGKNIPPIDKLKIIADVFGVSIDYLVDHEEQPNNDVFENIQNIIRTIEHSTDDVVFNSVPLDEKTQEMLCCTLSHALNVTNLLIKDEE